MVGKTNDVVKINQCNDLLENRLAWWRHLGWHQKKRRNVLILHLEIINILGMSDAWSGIYMKINERTALINFWSFGLVKWKSILKELSKKGHTKKEISQ